jgi:hypothetical protein
MGWGLAQNKAKNYSYFSERETIEMASPGTIGELIPSRSFYHNALQSYGN